MKFEGSLDRGEFTTIIASRCDREVTQFKCAASAQSDANAIELYRSSRLQPCVLQPGERSCRNINGAPVNLGRES